MYPRNAASPERIAIGAVVLISDGTVQTSGVTITVRGQGGAEATGGGTTAYGASGIVYYTPTQAETNFTSFVVIASKASCLPVAQTIVTTASSVAGTAILASATHTGAVIPTVSAVTGLTASNLDAAVSSRMATYTQPSGFLAATFPGAVASTTNITAGTITTAANLTNLPSIPANWITAAGITAGAMNGKGDWNVGKTGYSLTQSFPANFSAMSITAGGLVDITQGAADKAWGTASRVLTAGTNIALAKGTGITGFADLSATQVENAVWDATMASHLTGGTTGASLNGAGAAGDPWTTALPGAYGAGTAGNIIGNRIDAAITTRMASYTQPTGFLAATFPGTVASPTNITAATGVVLSGVTHTGAVIPTVTTTGTTTTLTNLPSIPAGWLTSSGIAAGALAGKGDWNIGKTGYSLTPTTGLGNQTANITGNLSGSVGSVTGLTAANLDVAVSTRLSTAGYTAAPTATDNADAVWAKVLP